MRLLYLTLAVSALLLSACKKDGNSGSRGCKDPASVNYDPTATEDDGSCLVPLNKQNALVIEYTSTKCHFCGEWGYDTFNNLYTKFGDDIIPIAVHSNLSGSPDPMEVPPLLASFTTCRPSGLPRIWVGDQAGANNYSNLISALKKNSPAAGVVLKSTRVGDSIIVKIQVKFFDNPSNDKWFGEYYINAYVVESGINGNSSAGEYAQSCDHDRPDYKHNFVLRTAGNPTGAYGVSLVTGTAGNPIQEYSVYNKTFRIKLNPSWNYDKLNVSAVLYLRQVNTYYFINGYYEK